MSIYRLKGTSTTPATTSKILSQYVSPTIRMYKSGGKTKANGMLQKLPTIETKMDKSAAAKQAAIPIQRVTDVLNMFFKL
mmetsp:Transcript_105753/g.166958  ORF Transcript_105753/g.166958 Transcript_105753/m.166958 type:complete len:80 (-) Transcript_105753:619-858(-)